MFAASFEMNYLVLYSRHADFPLPNLQKNFFGIGRITRLKLDKKILRQKKFLCKMYKPFAGRLEVRACELTDGEQMKCAKFFWSGGRKNILRALR